MKVTQKFPSPIYGASFKRKSTDEVDYYLGFPSPIYGASFKRLAKQVLLFDPEYGFPSPIYGASFKQAVQMPGIFQSIDGFRPLYTGLVSNSMLDLKEFCSLYERFPSPIYGASFKQELVM